MEPSCAAYATFLAFLAARYQGQGVALEMWNEPDESVSWVAELGEAMRWPANQPYEVGRDFAPILASGPFVNIERRQFSHQQLLDHDGLLQRVLTTS